MGDVIDSLTLALGTLQFIVMLCFMAFWFRAVGRLTRQALSGLNPSLARDQPSAKVLLRRLYCRHIEISRVKNAYGTTYTACTKCGHNVNEGRSKEEWR